MKESLLVPKWAYYLWVVISALFNLSSVEVTDHNENVLTEMTHLYSCYKSRDKIKFPCASYKHHVLKMYAGMEA
jgi:hypothetical protein